jgi:hypothetical protein
MEEVDEGAHHISVPSSLLFVSMFALNSNPAAGQEAELTPPIEPRAPTN